MMFEDTIQGYYDTLETQVRSVANSGPVDMAMYAKYLSLDVPAPMHQWLTIDLRKVEFGKSV